MKQSHPGKRLRVLFQDEARLGQQGSLTRVWAERGTRPTVDRQNGRQSVWVFGAVEPLTGRSISQVAAKANTFVNSRPKLTHLRASGSDPPRSDRSPAR